MLQIRSVALIMKEKFVFICLLGLGIFCVHVIV